MRLNEKRHRNRHPAQRLPHDGIGRAERSQRTRQYDQAASRFSLNTSRQSKSLSPRQMGPPQYRAHSQNVGKRVVFTLNFQPRCARKSESSEQALPVFFSPTFYICEESIPSSSNRTAANTLKAVSARVFSNRAQSISSTRPASATACAAKASCTTASSCASIDAPTASICLS